MEFEKDQLMDEVSELNLASQVNHAIEACQVIQHHEKHLEKIFKTKMLIGQAYEVDNLILLARIKFVFALMVKFAHNGVVLDELERTETRFDEFNSILKSIMANMQPHTSTLAYFAFVLLRY